MDVFNSSSSIAVFCAEASLGSTAFLLSSIMDMDDFLVAIVFDGNFRGVSSSTSSADVLEWEEDVSLGMITT